MILQTIFEILLVAFTIICLINDDKIAEIERKIVKRLRK